MLDNRLNISEFARRLKVSEGTVRFATRAYGFPEPLVDERGRKFYQWPEMREVWAENLRTRTRRINPPPPPLRRVYAPVEETEKPVAQSVPQPAPIPQQQQQQQPMREPPLPPAPVSAQSHGTPTLAQYQTVRTAQAATNTKIAQIKLKNMETEVPLEMRKKIAEAEQAEAKTMLVRIQLEKEAKLLVDAELFEDVYSTMVADARDSILNTSTEFRAYFPQASPEMSRFLDDNLREKCSALSPPVRETVKLNNRIKEHRKRKGHLDE